MAVELLAQKTWAIVAKLGICSHKHVQRELDMPRMLAMTIVTKPSLVNSSALRHGISKRGRTRSAAVARRYCLR
jgi:hypothetical protein